MDESTDMTAQERRASVSLALIFALRMLGLFLVLPVFAIEARHYPGGDDAALVGLTMGIYGLTQGLMQLPFGLASDRWGRKQVIVLGLVVFFAGSVCAALATSLTGLMVGRAIQGAGAVSAAVTALLADLTRDQVRTKAMALIGASIGLMFAISLVMSPLLDSWLGLSGLFSLTAVLTIAGIAVVVWLVPPQPLQHKDAERGGLWLVLQTPALMRLNVGVFILHAVQLSMWVAIPALLVQAGLPKDLHWRIYLPAVLGSFFLMGGLFALERRGYLRVVFLSAIGLIAIVQLAFMMMVGTNLSLLQMGGLLFAFFCGFNILEATQPSLVSRYAPAHSRGAAMGVYNTLQSLGLFVGGAMGGRLIKNYDPPALFLVCAILMGLWLVLAWNMQTILPRNAQKTA